MARMRHCNRAPCKSLVNTTEECNGGGEQGDGPSLVLLYITNENHKKIQNLITVYKTKLVTVVKKFPEKLVKLQADLFLLGFGLEVSISCIQK